MGEQQILLLPDLVGPLLELMLSEVPQIREVGIEMYYYLLQKEYQRYKFT